MTATLAEPASASSEGAVETVASLAQEWAKNRPFVRTPNGVKLLRFIVRIKGFWKFDRDGCSCRPK